MSVYYHKTFPLYKTLEDLNAQVGEQDFWATLTSCSKKFSFTSSRCKRKDSEKLTFLRKDLYSAPYAKCREKIGRQWGVFTVVEDPKRLVVDVVTT